MNNYIKIFFATALSAMALTSCVQPGDKFDPNREVLVVSGIEKGALVKFPVETAPASYPVVISTTGPVEKDVKVKIAVDNSLVEEYNKKNTSSYATLPETDYELSADEVTIPAGKASSNVVTVTLKSFDNFKDGTSYVIPVTIVSSDSNLEPLAAERTIYLRISRTLIHSSIDMNNSNFSSTFVFADDLKKEMSNYTFEIKVYPYSWNGMTPNLSRLCSFGDKNNGNSLLYRFGEKGETPVGDQLQVKTPAGELVSSHKYELNKWTMISVVYNGSNIALFNDGEKDVDNASPNEAMVWQCVELGMSWTTYRQTQLYHGRIAELRVWDRALTSGEIKAGLCGVPSDAEGLVAYFKFNENGGTVFKDASGHGYDMDWAKSVREYTDGEGNKPNPDAAKYINRVADDKNKCAN